MIKIWQKSVFSLAEQTVSWFLNNIHDTAVEHRRILASRDMKSWIPWEEAGDLLFENTFHKWREERREKNFLPIYPGCY